MVEFAQFLVSGLIVGAIYALVALGFSVTFRTTGIVNFAQGEFVMLGGLLTAGFVRIFDVSILMAAASALLLSMAVGWLLGTGLRRLRSATEFRLVLVTLATALGLQAVALMVFGPDPLRYGSPIGGGIIRLGEVTVVKHGILVVATALVLVVVLATFLKRTRWGRAMVATSNDRDAARSVGVNVGLVVTIAFVLAAALGAVGGLLLTPLAAISYNAGFLMSLKGFAAAVLGGMTSPLGAVAGGFIIGVVEAFASGYLSSGYKDSVALAALVLILIVRPEGLFGRQVRAA